MSSIPGAWCPCNISCCKNKIQPENDSKANMETALEEEHKAKAKSLKAIMKKYDSTSMSRKVVQSPKPGERALGEIPACNLSTETTILNSSRTTDRNTSTSHVNSFISHNTPLSAAMTVVGSPKPNISTLEAITAATQSPKPLTFTFNQPTPRKKIKAIQTDITAVNASAQSSIITTIIVTPPTTHKGVATTNNDEPISPPELLSNKPENNSDNKLKII